MDILITHHNDLLIPNGIIPIGIMKGQLNWCGNMWGF